MTIIVPSVCRKTKLSINFLQRFPMNLKKGRITRCFIREIEQRISELLESRFNPILDGVRAHPILDGGRQKSPPVLTLPFSV